MWCCKRKEHGGQGFKWLATFSQNKPVMLLFVWSEEVEFEVAVQFVRGHPAHVPT